MVRRHELFDAEWARLAPLLPPRQGNGHPYAAHRKILNGMLFRLRTGVPWRDLPRRYGKWQTVYSRWRRWTRAGLSDRVLATLQRELGAAGQIEWDLGCIDGSSVRAHKAAASTGKNAVAPQVPREPADRELGRSRGGFGTKIHLVSDDQRARRAHRPGRKPALDRVAYRRRNVVERANGLLKEARAVATRLDKLALHYRAVLKLAILVQYLHVTLANTPLARTPRVPRTAAHRARLPLPRWPHTAPSAAVSN